VRGIESYIFPFMLILDLPMILSAFCHDIGFVTSTSQPSTELPTALYQVYVTGDYFTFIFLNFCFTKISMGWEESSLIKYRAL
jgi:hypothetical protein